MKSKLAIVFILSMYCLSLSSEEKIYMKSKDIYSCDIVYIDAKKLVFFMLGERFEINVDQIEKIDFASSQNEFEILLDDKTSIKGQIVEEDEDYYTVGSSAGINKIERKKVKEINNPKMKEFRSQEKKYSFKFHTGLTPYTTFVLNDVSKSYQSYWSLTANIESNFYTMAWFGIDISFMMLIPQWGVYNDFLFLTPINFTVMYEDNFYRSKVKNHWSNNLFWHVKMGFGFSPVIFHEIAEKRTSSSVSFSSMADIGIKYYFKKFFALGISGRTNLFAQKYSYMIMQSAGLILEFKF
jgi:hypothetical protein